MKPEKKEDVKLTDAQQAKLQDCEIVIEDGLKAFLKTCIAVVVIDDLELYKPHKSLHAYCAFRFDYSDTETGRLRNAGHVLVNLSGLSADDLFSGKESDIVLPANEGQCREMAKLKKGKSRMQTCNERCGQKSSSGRAKIRSLLGSSRKSWTR